MPPELPFDAHDSWENHLGNQSVDPLRIYEPESIEQVAAIVGEAGRTGVTARAVGSGHSWSDVALTTGFVILTRQLHIPGTGDLLRHELTRPSVHRTVAPPV